MDEFFNRIKSGDPTKLVVVIDEFQYIARKDVGFMNSILKLKAKKLYLGSCYDYSDQLFTGMGKRKTAEKNMVNT